MRSIASTSLLARAPRAWLRACAVLMAVLAATASTAWAQDAQALDKLAAAELQALAEKEGKVVVYSFTSRIARIEKAFEARYPKIDLVAFDVNSTQQIARLKAESNARISNADVAYISDMPVVYEELVKPGILSRYVPAEFAARVPQALQQPLLANRLSTKVLMYNEQAYADGAPVRNLWELTQPKWRGRVVSVDPTVRGDYLDLFTEIVLRHDEMAKAYEQVFGQPIRLRQGESAGEKWLKDWLANQPVFVANTDAVADAIGKLGQKNPPVGFATYSDRRDNQERSRALQVAADVQPAAGILFPASLGLVKGGKNPAAARLLVQFMMGDDSPHGGPGFAPFYVAGDYAARTDIAPHPDARPLAQLNAWRIDPAKTVTARKKVADLILAHQ
ncbi:MAG: ABC transporter substrate-binding protein [Pseudomonadota bacterium]|nr:ABC transporter substrate-binding protein [Pseudomonadota bacterium]